MIPRNQNPYSYPPSPALPPFPIRLHMLNGIAIDATFSQVVTWLRDRAFPFVEISYTLPDTLDADTRRLLRIILERAKEACVKNSQGQDGGLTNRLNELKERFAAPIVSEQIYTDLESALRACLQMDTQALNTVSVHYSLKVEHSGKEYENSLGALPALLPTDDVVAVQRTLTETFPLLSPRINFNFAGPGTRSVFAVSLIYSFSLKDFLK